MSKEKLLIVWSNGDKEVAMKFPLLYGSVILEREYWKEAHIMIWGPSIKLAAHDSEVRAQLRKIAATGVAMSACIVCVEDYDAVEALESLGVNNVHTGEMLTECLKSDAWEVMTV